MINGEIRHWDGVSLNALGGITNQTYFYPVHDGMRVFTIRSLVAAKDQDLNKALINDIVREQFPIDGFHSAACIQQERGLLNGLFIILGIVSVGLGTFTLKSQQVAIGNRDELDGRVAHLHGLLRVIAGLVTLAGVIFSSLDLLSLGTLGIMFGGGVTLLAQTFVNWVTKRSNHETR